MESPSLTRKTGGRRRHQRGSLIDDGDRWIARWREDVRLPNGTVKRVRRKDVIASKKGFPTRRMAQRKLDELLRSVNEGSRVVLPSDLRAVEVVLCDACRERLLAALQDKPKGGRGLIGPADRAIGVKCVTHLRWSTSEAGPEGRRGTGNDTGENTARAAPFRLLPTTAHTGVCSGYCSGCRFRWACTDKDEIL
jgi:hypothetical protein